MTAELQTSQIEFDAAIKSAGQMTVAIAFLEAERFRYEQLAHEIVARSYEQGHNLAGGQIDAIS